MKQINSNKNAIIESKTNYWMNMSLMHKHLAIGHKIEVFE